MKTPGPDHPITLAPAPLRMRASIMDHVLADSAAATVLKEADYPEVVYFPRGDVEMGFLTRTDHASHCPYKGDAAYYSIFLDGQLYENVAWSYEQPFPAMEGIRDLIAFYPDRTQVYAVAEAV